MVHGFKARTLVRGILTLTTALLLALPARAVLSGTKNIPGDYATLALATTDLNAQGVDTGGVTLNVLTGNPETAPAGTAVVRKQIAVSLKC